MHRQHISKRFDQELQDIRNHVLKMGGLVEQQIEAAISALLAGDIRAAEDIIVNDVRVNAWDVAIDEECTHILARRQPAAGDLRLIMAVIKTITDLERMGDEAKRIARIAIDLASHYPRKTQLSELEQLSHHVRGMLREALDAFARTDLKLSLRVSREDAKVDQEYENIVRQQITYMMEDPRLIPLSLDITWSARSLERIGDRSCNICEYVIYQIKGKDVRHTSPDQLEDELWPRRSPSSATGHKHK